MKLVDCSTACKPRSSDSHESDRGPVLAPVILSLLAVLSTFASLLLVFDSHWGTFTTYDGTGASGHVGLWATCTNNTCVPMHPDLSITMVRIMTLFGVGWMLLLLTAYAVFPMDLKTKCAAIGMGFSGKGVLNFTSSLIYLAWIRVDASRAGAVYNTSVSDYVTMGLAMFDMILGAIGRS